MKALFCIMLFTISNIALSQESQLFIPKEVKASYDAKTRSLNGEPGSNYWQNGADYSIKVKLDPETRMVTGSETIVYSNNSPDSLNYLVVRLYQNLYKKGAVRHMEVEPEDLHDGVDIKKVMINGKKLEDGKIKIRGTNMFLSLSKAIKTNSKTTINIEWEFIIPEKTKIRMGTYDPTSFFVGLWYPQIAVYDDIHKWDTQDYTGAQEFYNNYGDFNVEITVPRNFIVWATGENINRKELLPEKYLQKIEKAKQNPNVVIHVVDDKDVKSNKLTADNEWNTWKYKATNVPDFAFGTSDHYLWDVVATDVDGKQILIHSAYQIKNNNFNKVAYISKETIKYLSEEFPGIPYPYPQFTAFQGHSGMEFPMMSNQGDFESHNDAVYATSHEITHTYFPFLVGTNERLHAWIDEGFAVLLPEEIQFRLDSTKNLATYTTRVYSYYSGREFEPAVITPTIYLYGTWYFIINYGKAEQAFRLIRREIGEELFTKVLKEFVERWEGKHPIPYDLFNTINDVSGENLDWFYKEWFFGQGIPDLKLKEVNDYKNGVEIVIEKIGNLPVPIVLTIHYKDGNTKVLEYKAEKWKDEQEILHFKLKSEETKEITKVVLGDDEVPDSNKRDNVFVIDNQ